MSQPYEHSFAIDEDSNEVRSILFKRTLNDGDIEVSVSRGWKPKTQDRRVQDWTDEQVEIEYLICNQTVDFAGLLRKRLAKRKGMMPLFS